MLYLNLSLDKLNWKRIYIEDKTMAIIMAVADIKNFTARQGSGSKSITIPDIRDNHINLKEIFDLKTNDLTYVKKKCYAQIIQNDELFLDNYMFVLEEVIYSTESSNEKRTVKYKAKIFNAVTNFYQSLDSKYLTDINLDKYSHIYSSTKVVNSFKNTYLDGYKYILPFNYSTGSINYTTKDFYPGIYALTYFDEIHKQAGYRYSFPQMDDSNILFKKLIHPFTGDIKKLIDDKIINYSSQAISNQTVSHEMACGMDPTDLDGIKNSKNINLTSVVTDPNGSWTVGSTTLFNNQVMITTPDYNVFNVGIDYKLFLKNTNTGPITNNITGTMTHSNSFAYIHLEAIRQSDNKVVASRKLTPDVLTNIEVGPNGEYRIKGNLTIPTGNSLLLYSAEDKTYSLTISNANVGDKYFIRCTLQWLEWNDPYTLWQSTGGSVDNIIRVPKSLRMEYKNVSITQQYKTDNLLISYKLPMKTFIHAGIKQTDYLLSIMRIFNLYAETDVNDERLIIYKTRDNYYNTGNNLGDLTNRVDYSKGFTSQYVPDINNKTTILTYKQDDKDPALKTYLATTEETFGMQEIVYDNENSKGIEKQEVIFSPTVNVNTSFGANVPLLPYIPNVNMRILLDMGEMPCDTYKIADSTTGINEYVLNNYPYVGMLNHPTNPTFSLEFGVSEYYLHDLTLTYNNIYYNHYQNMFKLFNSYSIATAYMHLDSAFINKLRMNDRFTIDNKEYYFNKIIDYQPNQTYTKVELISSDDVLKTPIIKKGVLPVINNPGIDLTDINITIFNTDGVVIDTGTDPNPLGNPVLVDIINTVHDPIVEEEIFPVLPTSVIDTRVPPVKPKTPIINTNIKDYWQNTNVDPTGKCIFYGSGNVVQEGITAVVFGNDKEINTSGVYVDDLFSSTINGVETDIITDYVTNQINAKNPIHCTRAQLLANFVDGFYYITDKSIYAKILDLNPTYYKKIDCPKKSFYEYGRIDPDFYYIIAFFDNTKSYLQGDKVIYANKVWINKTGITGFQISKTQLDSNWLVSTSSADYEKYDVYLQYDIVADILTSAYDPIKNNRLSFLDIDDYHMITDWNNPHMLNNSSEFGIYNNQAPLIRNNISGSIFNNTGLILNNRTGYICNCRSNYITNNNVPDGIINVKATYIQNNYCVSIEFSTISGNCANNYLTGSIKNLTPIVLNVVNNRCHNITNPTLISGNITDTVVNK